jgi:Right handed beta helix region
MLFLQLILTIFLPAAFNTTGGNKSGVSNISQPIKIENKSNFTIENETIVGGTSPCILLINCANVHIVHCTLINSTDIGIRLEGCFNVLIDSNEIGHVKTGVFAITCPLGHIRVVNNQMKNMLGPYPQADFVQFDRVSGGDNQICYNKLQNVAGQSNPEDGINLYMSNGLPNNPILVGYNWIRGGGPSITGAGITAGDGGGSYQEIVGNIVVNSGYGGIQVAGGTYIQILYNRIYSRSLPWSGFGLASSNYSGKPCSQITISENSVNWLAGKLGGIKRDTVYKAGTGTNANPVPIAWRTNTDDKLLGENLLPDKIVNF